MGFPDLIDTHLALRTRQRGFTEAQMIETIVLLQTIAALYEQHDQRLSIATIHQDATLIESHTQAAYPTCQGGRGYPADDRAVSRSRPAPPAARAPRSRPGRLPVYRHRQAVHVDHQPLATAAPVAQPQLAAPVR